MESKHRKRNMLNKQRKQTTFKQTQNTAQTSNPLLVKKRRAELESEPFSWRCLPRWNALVSRPTRHAGSGQGDIRNPRLGIQRQARSRLHYTQAGRKRVLRSPLVAKSCTVTTPPQLRIW